MTFQGAIEELLAKGFQESSIRRMKVHLSEPWAKERIDEVNASTVRRRAKLKKLLAEADDEITKAIRKRQLDQCKMLPDDAGAGVFPIYEDGPDQSAARLDGAKFTEKAEIIRYRLDQGTLASSNREFWVPCAYDGVKGWEEYYCAPHWIESADGLKAFCERYYREKSWPDEKGEVAEDPIRFINSELSLLRSANQFKGSSDIDLKFRGKSAINMQSFSEVAFEYLSKAIETSLKRTEPEHRQLSQDKMRDNQGICDYVNAEAMRIIELAFRAGRVAATASLHYRGIPVEAERAKPLTDGQSKRGPKKEWTKAARDFLSENPDAKSADIARHLKEQLIVDWEPQDAYRNAHTISFYDGTDDKTRERFQKDFSKLKNS